MAELACTKSIADAPSTRWARTKDRLTELFDVRYRPYIFGYLLSRIKMLVF
jgi:hypothetical protein